MSLCFVDPADAIRAIADSIGREARRQLLGEAVRAWVDEIPDSELEVHYAKAIAELDEHDLSMLAAWHGSLEVGQPVPNRDFLMGAFGSLGENRREALKLAAGFRGEEAVDAGVTEDDALELVLGLLSPPRLMRSRSRRSSSTSGTAPAATTKLGRGPCKPAHFGVLSRSDRVTHLSALPSPHSLRPPNCLVFEPVLCRTRPVDGGRGGP